MAKVFHRLMRVEDAAELVKRHLKPLELDVEYVALAEAVGRVLAESIAAPVDSPPFDRSRVDGYAVYSGSLADVDEGHPARLRLVGAVRTGELPRLEVKPGEAAEIHTGAPMPRGADSVVMAEYTKRLDGEVLVYRSTHPGENVSQAGTDVMVGEVVVRRGVVLTPREIGVLAALGLDRVPVYRRLRVAVLSTGAEVQPPGRPLEPGKIYDVNSYTISCMARELGCEPHILGIYPDDLPLLRKVVGEAVERYDVVLSSGSTSAGFGDIIYRVFDSLGEPGVLVHGLLMRPGKPTVAAVVGGKLLVGLPGFPVSAMMAFHVFVKPLISHLIGVPLEGETRVSAELPFRIQAGGGRRVLVPVSLVSNPSGGYSAYPVPGDSGAVSRLALADGFIECPEDREFLDEGECVYVTLFSRAVKPADLAVIGSHCPGLDILLELLGRGLSVKTINVGSLSGFLAVRRGEADIAGTHLLDPDTMRYNIPYINRYGLEGRAVLVRGYARMQGFMVRGGNPKRIRGFEDLLREDVVMVNRNRGSGTRVLIDLGLRRVAERLGMSFEDAVRRVRGYSSEAKTHSAVAAAVAQGRCDVGVGVEAVAHVYGLDFIPIAEEIYDFLIPRDRLGKPSVKLFLETLRSERFKHMLEDRLKGYRVLEETGCVVYGG